MTVPMAMWRDWIEEGDLPGDEPEYESHFWIPAQSLPQIEAGDRVYIVAHGRLRGYAPLVRVEPRCKLRRTHACLLREGDAEAVTIPEAIRGFTGWRYRWWERKDEVPFPDWQTAGVR